MMIKTYLVAAIFILISGCSNSNPVTGYWTGAMTMNGKSVDISVDFSNSTFSCCDLMFIGEPVSNVKFSGNTISFSFIPDIVFEFNGTVEKENITGTVSIRDMPPNMKISFNLNRISDAPPGKSYSVENLTIKSKDANLSGEIYKPNTGTLHPALVLLHGSTTNLKSQYTFYSDYFANLGFEVLIFDKRGSGKSTGDYNTSSYNNLVDDAIACLEIMKSRKSIDKNRIGLWGFSQGAMLLPMIVSKTEIPSFIIAISPELFSVTEAGAFSDSLRVINSGNSPEDGHVAAESHRMVEYMIRSGSDYQEVEKFIAQNAKRNTFMNYTGLFGSIEINKNEFESYYWKGRTENFYPYWEKLKIPALVIYGEDDNLVNTARNAALIKNLNQENISVKIFSGANHSLKKVFNPSKNSDFDWPRIIDGYKEFVKAWIEKNKLILF